MLGCFPLGAAALGAAPLSTDVEFEVCVNGQDRTGSSAALGVQALSISDVLSGRSSCDISLYDEANTYFPRVGQRVVVRHHGAKKFAGTVEEVKRTVNDTGGQGLLSLRCVDFNQLCDRFHVTASYDNLDVRSIVEDIVNVQTPLALEGVSIGEVDRGPRIARAVFNRVTINEAFRSLSEASGLTWNIDYNLVLNFFERETYDAPVDVTDADPHWEGLDVSDSRDQYRNKQLLRAGDDRTSAQQDTFRGDAPVGSPEKRRRTFTLGFRVAPGPTAVDGNSTAGWYDNGGNFSATKSSTFKHPLVIRKNGVAQRLGIKGKDKDGDLTEPSTTTWPQWFYEVGSQEVSQNSKSDEVGTDGTTANKVLTETDILDVHYVGLFPIIVETQSDDEIATRQAVEGGTGIYEQLESDEDLDGNDFAVEKANRLLLLYGRIPREATYSTIRQGLAAGQVQNFNLADHQVSNVQYLIDQVRHTLIRHSPGVEFRAAVTALEGDHREVWTDFFRRLAKAKQKRTINENEKLLISRQFRDKLTLSDAVTDSVNHSVTLNAYTDDPYNWARVGVVTVSGTGEQVAAARLGSRIGAPHGA